MFLQGFLQGIFEEILPVISSLNLSRDLLKNHLRYTFDNSSKDFLNYNSYYKNLEMDSSYIPAKICLDLIEFFERFDREVFQTFMQGISSANPTNTSPEISEFRVVSQLMNVLSVRMARCSRTQILSTV